MVRDDTIGITQLLILLVMTSLFVPASDDVVCVALVDDAPLFVLLSPQSTSKKFVLFSRMQPVSRALFLFVLFFFLLLLLLPPPLLQILLLFGHR